MAEISREERLTDLSAARAGALGRILGLVDTLILAERHPDVFSMKDTLMKLREARAAYNEARDAYLNERLAEL